MTIDELRESRKKAWTELKSCSIQYKRATKLLSSIEARLKAANDRYESVDRELAKLDGRFQVVEPNVRKQKRPPEAANLTLDDLYEIAEKLGISLEGNNVIPDEEPPYEQDDAHQ